MGRRDLWRGGGRPWGGEGRGGEEEGRTDGRGEAEEEDRRGMVEFDPTRRVVGPGWSCGVEGKDGWVVALALGSVAG